MRSKRSWHAATFAISATAFLLPTGLAPTRSQADEPLRGEGAASISDGLVSASVSSPDPILSAIKLIEDDNAPAPTAAVMAPRTADVLAKFKATDNQPLARPPKISSLPFLTSNQIPIDDVQGSATDASRILIGHWPDMTLFLSRVFVLPLRERYADKLQFALVLYVYADVIVQYPESFASVTGIIP